MTASAQRRSGGYLERPAPSGLADVVEIILDKGIVIDAYVRVSLVGIELLTIDARIVIASVDTYLRFAEATNRLDLYEKGGKDLTEVISDVGGPVVEKVASKVAQSKVEGGIEKVGGALGKVEDVVEDVTRTAKKVPKKVAKKAKGLVTPD
jgi:gas vesicle structural protein